MLNGCLMVGALFLTLAMIYVTPVWSVWWSRGGSSGLSGLDVNKKEYGVVVFYGRLWCYLLVCCYMVVAVNVNCLFYDLSFYGLCSLNSLSLGLVLLSLWVVFLASFASVRSILWGGAKVVNFTSLFPVLCAFLCGSFVVDNMMGFYVCFEGCLLPMIALVSIWGKTPERVVATYYLVVYTVMGSLPLLVCLLSYSHVSSKTFWFESVCFPWGAECLFFLCFMVAFLVKLPCYPFHLWLLKAHVEAPVGGSMVLAGVMLKLGGFGMMQSLAYFKVWPGDFVVTLIVFSLLGGTLASAVCLRQVDMKLLVAYSSVSHMSYAAAGILSASSYGWASASVGMITHGLCSSGLFYLVDSVQQGVNSRSILAVSGLIQVHPKLAFWWFMFCCANMPAPPTAALAAEGLLFPAVSQVSVVCYLFLFVAGCFSAAYNLYIFASTQLGGLGGVCSVSQFYAGFDHMVCLLHFLPLCFITLNMSLMVGVL